MIEDVLKELETHGLLLTMLGRTPPPQDSCRSIEAGLRFAKRQRPARLHSRQWPGDVHDLYAGEKLPKFIDWRSSGKPSVG